MTGRIPDLELSPRASATIAGTSSAIRRSERTCTEVLEECLTRIDAGDAEVRAWVMVDHVGARARARRLDEDLAAGRWRGPLHGIPLGIKDIIDVAEMPTAAGYGPWSGRVATADAPIVRQLRRAGAVIVGKTTTTQFAWIDPPATLNPWNLAHTPGGSSSGSAAAVACGMCLGSLGTQTGGSIIRPAAFCGVAGFKPTHGLLPLRGIMPFAPSLDHPGPLARTVGDLELLWSVLSRNPSEVSSPAPPRCGRLRGLFEERAEIEAVRVLDSTIAALRAAGAEIVEILLPADFNEILASHRTIMAAQAALRHQARMAASPATYLDHIGNLVREGLTIPAVDYLRARADQRDWARVCTELFGANAIASTRIDSLICPAATGPAPLRTIGTTGDPVLNSPWSYTGLPAVCFPVSMSSNGLPIGVQLVGLPRSDTSLLAVARWCEQQLQRDAAK